MSNNNNRNNNLITPVRWYGSKKNLTQWLYRWFPTHSRFVDVFGGGGSVLLRKTPVAQEVYADADTNIVEYYNVVKTNALALRSRIFDIPCSRDNLFAASERMSATTDPVEKAAWYHLAKNGSFSGEHSGERLSYGFVGATASKKIGTYWKRALQLPLLAERLRNVAIVCADFEDTLSRYDDPDTLFYLDPPYVHEMRSSRGRQAYDIEMTDQDHERLLRKILTVKGKVALSGYDLNFQTGATNTLYRSFLKGWSKISVPVKARSARWNKGGEKTDYREECLWFNAAAFPKSPLRLSANYTP